MRTADAFLRRGVAKLILNAIAAEASDRGYLTRSLETGSQPEFAPARALYSGAGFEPCRPFAHYTNDPNSVFRSRRRGP